MKAESVPYRLITLLLRLGLIAGLFAAGWFVYVKFPHSETETAKPVATTNLNIVLQPSAQFGALDVPLQLYPIDLVAARHEYFAERRAGKRFEDFLKERMNGRTPVTARLNAQGRASLLVSPGKWWVHAVISGNEELEWRLPITVTSEQQTIELTPENVYTRTKSF